jgi:hypothetical protein
MKLVAVSTECRAANFMIDAAGVASCAVDARASGSPGMIRATVSQLGRDTGDDDDLACIGAARTLADVVVMDIGGYRQGL